MGIPKHGSRNKHIGKNKKSKKPKPSEYVKRAKELAIDYLRQDKFKELFTDKRI
jgi:hypothetical protein